MYFCTTYLPTLLAILALPMAELRMSSRYARHMIPRGESDIGRRANRASLYSGYHQTGKNMVKNEH